LVSDGRLLKTNNPYKNAKKHVTISGMIGMDYSRGVNNQLAREGAPMEFSASLHPWMVHAEKNLGKNAKKNDDKRYVPIKVQSASKAVYMHNEQNVTELIQDFIPKKKSPKTQDTLIKKVIWRTPELSSITCIRMLGAEYTIV